MRQAYFNVECGARLSILAAVAALLIQAVPQARAEEPYYRAALNEPAMAKLIAKEIMWSCAGNDCSAKQSGSRPVIVCGALARRAGPLAAFSAGGAPLDEATLRNAIKAQL